MLLEKDENKIPRFSFRPFKIIENIQIASNTFLLVVESANSLDHFSAKPFNFFNIWVPRVDEIPLSIAYQNGKRLFFLYKLRGLGTKTLAQQKVGSFIGIKGPLGRGFEPKRSEKWLIVAGGIGIAPIPMLIKRALELDAKLDIFWGVRVSTEFFDIAKIFGLPNEAWSIVRVSEDCMADFCGLVIDAIRSVNVDKYDGIIAIGPQEMLKTFCKQYGESRENTYVSLETIVKCGMGICGSCYIRESEKLLCVDGPVFRCSEVAKQLEGASA